MHKDAHEIMVTRSQEKRTRHEFVKNSQKAFREFPSFPFPLRAALDRGEPSERKLDGNIPPLLYLIVFRTGHTSKNNISDGCLPP